MINTVKNKKEMENTFYSELGQKIKLARGQAKISQKKLAQALGRRSATFTALIESGKRKLSIEGLTKIAIAIGKPLNYFFDDDFSVLSTREILRIAFRSDPDLTYGDQKKMIEFYDFLKFSKQKRKIKP